MISRLIALLKRVLWLYYGEVAKTVVEDYDTTGNVVGSVVAAVVLTGGILYAIVVIGVPDSLVGLFLTFLLWLLAPVALVGLAVHVGAAIVFARQPTEVPVEGVEVSD